jgi:hypothetical protein
VRLGKNGYRQVFFEEVAYFLINTKTKVNWKHQNIYIKTQKAFLKGVHVAELRQYKLQEAVEG